MKYLSHRYGVYRFSDGQYLLSLMTTGLDPIVPRKKKRSVLKMVKDVCRRYRSLFFIAAVFSAAQDFIVLMSLSVLFLIISLCQRKKQ